MTEIAAAAGLAGCLDPRDDEARFPAIEETISIVETIPAADAVGFDPRGQIDICFSGVLDPTAVSTLDAALYSGRIRYDSELDTQLFAWRPPGSATGVSETRWCPGSVVSIRPRDPLEPGLGYRVRLRASAVGWAGESLDTSTPGWSEQEFYDDPQVFWLEFTTAAATSDDDVPPGEDPDPGPTLTELFAPGEVFAADEPACSCHREEGLARELLDLTTPARAFDDLVRVQTPMSTGSPMVSPRDPSESYLVQTLLREGDAALYTVRGQPMPPEAELEYRHMTSIARWIEDGARP